MILVLVFGFRRETEGSRSFIKAAFSGSDLTPRITEEQGSCLASDADLTYPEVEA